MGSLFNIDSPLMMGLSKITDLVWLNILTLICCIPVFTIGTSLTAMYYVLFKMVKKEESYITRTFFRAFKENFKKSTIMWLIIVLFLLIFYGDYRIITTEELNFPMVMSVIIMSLGVFFAFMIVYIFPLQARFENKIGKMFLNAFIMSISNLPRTILLIILFVLPFAVVIYFPSCLPIVFLIGVTGTAYMSSFIYIRVFKKYEPKDEVEEEIPIDASDMKS